MEKTGLRMFAGFAVLLVLMSILPAGALAASDNAKNDDMRVKVANAANEKETYGNDQTDDNADEDKDDSADTAAAYIRDHDRDRDMVNAKEDATRKRTESMNAVARYQAARDNFAIMRSNNPNIDTEEAINATREYLNSSISYMISRLDEEDDSEYIKRLGSIREDVNAATTRKELADAAKDIRSVWNDARKDRIISAGRAIDNRMNAVIRTSETLMLRLENEIATMKENGEDTEDLEEMLARYRELIAGAKENQERARNTYMNGNGTVGENVREANRYIEQAGKDIRDANAILRNILTELKQHRQGVVVLSGNGTLNAEGNGTAVISGDVTIDLTITDAKLVIKDLAGDARIEVADNTEYGESNVEEGNSTDNNRAFVFMNITGDVHIEGSRLTVMVRGSDIELTAEGTGTAVLSGNGTYETVGGSGNWAGNYADPGDVTEDGEDHGDEESENNDASQNNENESNADASVNANAALT
ncbi:hypothetical protein [Methanolobus sp. WCC5]|jgi:hypothetical protein|uniref:hypothetical protein n=1 Tax=Methanolobus sp. WCC5 TaxID=3125785 RepID=UPI00324CC3D8